MTTLHQRADRPETIKFDKKEDGRERRRHRRHDMEPIGITVQRWDGARQAGHEFGTIVDLSAGGVRIRTDQPGVRADHQIRVKMELPAYAGICPFVDTRGGEPQPKREWIGWLAVNRVQKLNAQAFDVAGTLVDMEDLDRSMLGLYLSTQPLAA